MPKRIDSSVVFGVCVLLCMTSALQGQDKKFELAGEYKCVGDNADGGQYEGTVKITAHRDTFKLQWTIGEESHMGVGIFDGETFSVCWATEGGGGIVVYKLQKDNKTLEGRWAPLGGDGKVLKETLTKTKGVTEA